MTLAELDKWDPDAIHSVFSAVTDHSESTRLTSDGLGQVINAVPWEGKAHDAALAANTDIRRDLNLHADELEAVANAAKAAETEIRSIKSDWQHLQQEASAAGMTIDPVAGTVSYVKSSDPDEAAIQEHNYEVICEEVHRLLQRADQADGDLAAAIDGADGHKSADDVNKQLSNHWVETKDSEKKVHDALGGDKDAATQVNGVLDSITPEQQAGLVPLTPEQAAVLSQLQAQENGMSVDALQTAEQRLGDQKGMIGNSWQLMSNPKVQYPKTELKPGAQTDMSTSVTGGKSQLPTSVQQALDSSGLLYTDQANTIASIVKDGEHSFQHNTDVDRALLHKGSVMMDAPLWQHDPASNGRDGFGRDPALDPAVSNILSAAAPDHQVVHDAVTAPGGAGDRFLHNVTHHFWADDGKAVASLFDWTGPAAQGPEAQIAGQTGEAYARYIGSNPDLLSLPGNHTLGQVNPELVRGMAHGLTPYISDIADTQGGSPWFKALDTGTDLDKGRMPIAKGIFSVLSTDPDASRYFNGSADARAIAAENAFTQEIKTGTATHAEDANLHDAATLRGLVDSGVQNATQAGLNNHQTELVSEYEQKKSAYEFGVKALSTGSELVPKLPGVTGPAIDLLGSTLEEDFLGKAPTGGVEVHPLADMPVDQAHREILNAMLSQGNRPDGLPPELLMPIDPGNPNGPMRVATPDELRDQDVKVGNYSQTLSDAYAQLFGQSPGNHDAMAEYMTKRYDAVVKDPDAHGSIG